MRAIQNAALKRLGPLTATVFLVTGLTAGAAQQYVDWTNHASRKASRSPLVLNASLGTIGATIQNARIETGDARPLATALGRVDRFENLDRNRDGVITRREWSGSRRN